MNPTLLAFAVGSLLLGLALNFLAAKNPRTNQICWLLFALFPALLLFYFFPNSTTSGTLFGFTMSGAVALFVFTWWYGSTKTAEAVTVEELKAKIKDLEARPAVPGQAPRVITQVGRHPYRVRAKTSKKIVLVTGGIQKVTYADIWVNSENTNMQMARFFERSVSSTIRCLGAAHDDVGEITDDLIGKALANAMHGRTAVPPAAVIATDPGSLARSHNVKRLFHVAAVVGEPGGYRPVQQMQDCVANAFAAAEREPNCRSIVFPILGAGTGRGDLAALANVLLVETVGFFESENAKQVDTAYVLTWTDVEFDMCKGILDGLAQSVEPVA